MDQRECNTHREVILYQTEATTQPKTQHDKKETKKEMIQQNKMQHDNAAKRNQKNNTTKET